jgi:hypothetical protein
MSGISRLNRQIQQRLGNDSVYGPGLDGNVVIATNTTLSSDMYYNNLTINSGVILNTNGYKVFVKETLTLNGAIGNGTISGSTIGEPSGNIADATLAGTSSSSSIIYSIGGSGGGGTSSAVTALPEAYRKNVQNLIDSAVPDASTQSFVSIKGGSSGTTGTTGATAPIYQPSTWPGQAGGQGSNGTYIPNSTTVNAPGGRGNSGNSGTKTGATVGPGGAGGLGGRGGAIVLVCAKNITGSGKIVSLGISGSSGSAGATGSPGSPGAAKTAYSSTTQRGSSGSNLNDGHQAPSISHANPNAGAHGAYNTHNHTHIPHHGHGDYAIHHIALVGRNFHSHSYAFDTGYKGLHTHAHAGHTHPGHQYGHNHHFQHADSGHHGHNANQNHYVYGHSHPGHFGHYHVSNNHANIHGTGPHHNHEPHIGHTNSHTTQNWIHVPANPGHHVAPTVYSGGAGGDPGVGAPAVTGSPGKRGGAGGGGGAIVVTNNALPESILIDTRSGLLSEVDNFSASNGYSYVIIN